MAYMYTFRRYEIKYMITQEEKSRIVNELMPHMQLDKYGKSTIRNVYFDTDDFRLIRRSIEKPVYKEKLRLRSYSQATKDSTVFAELKKKYEKVVYKRRLSLTEKEATEWLTGNAPCPVDTQISREIEYFSDFYSPLKPTVFLSYEREAYYMTSGEDFRITFDRRILARTTDLSLCSSVYGTPLLPDESILMEIKCSGGIPLWMTAILSREKIYKTSFSKYGTAYTKLIFPYLYSSDVKNERRFLKNG